ncbi:MAG: DUF1670 domain-containing protein [Gammaproteobacteria bacterium]|nr:DUF1670 domain-containing protein [Gammaproteobacteria bacterium]
MNAKEKERLQAKTPEQRFKHMLKTEYGFSGKMAALLVEEAQEYLQGKPDEIKLGQMRVILAARKARHGQALSATPTQEVLWTVDAGEADREVLCEHGPVTLRRRRIQRLLEEALEQDAMATQEDLAQVLQVTARTIKRDFAHLHAAGEWLPSRGYLKGIGRGQTHKAQIVKRWLHGETYDQLVRHTHHAGSSIRRYVQTFVQVMQLEQQGFESLQIAQLVQIGVPLVGEYLTIWQENKTSATRERLTEQIQRLQKRTQGEKKGAK